MSQQEPNRPNPPHTPPQQPAPNQTNWGFIFLVTIILGILLFAFFAPNSLNSSVHKISLPEFKKAYAQGIIVLDKKKAPIEVVLSETSPDGIIYAWQYPANTPVTITEQFFYMPFAVDNNVKNILNNLGICEGLSNGSSAPSLQAEKLSLETFKTLGEEGRLQGKPGKNGEQGELPIVYYNSNGTQGVVVGKYITRKWPELDQKMKSSLERVEVAFSREFQGDEVKSLLGDTAAFGTEANIWRTLLFYILPIVLILMLIFFSFRSRDGGARSAMNFSKSRARLQDPKNNRITFKDVAGVSEAKEEVWELVEFLRNPKKFHNLGGSIPKGVLMVGPPGTGKTLLAKAIAGEAGVPFYTISGSDFMEMFVGVGAARVRDMFAEAKKHAPCLIFIDEIDAVGRHRGAGLGGGHDEREQTLNALLVEMDGFASNENVIVIAATNRVDVLDPALLRPGRFDRQVVVNLPDIHGREQILAVHARKIKLTPDVDLSPVARATPGFSGAELANLINEAALIAARKNLNSVTQAELEEAREKVRWGRERRSLSLSEAEKHNTAVHEAGHAICLLKLPLRKTLPLHKVTIIPRGPALGVTMMLPEEDKHSEYKSEMLDSIVMAMGGRVAEEITFGDISGGAMGDIRMATNTARKMVCAYGMSDKLGPVEYGSEHGEVFLGRDLTQTQRNYSEHTAQLIDTEVREIVENGYRKAKEILSANKDRLELIANALMEYETLNGEQVADLLENGVMSNPPTKETPPPLPEEEEMPTDLETPTDQPPPVSDDTASSEKLN